jgi:hypothetical protein
MGQSTNAILAYGYDLGGENDGWNVNEADEYGGLRLGWWNGNEDFIEAAKERLLAELAGLTETDWQADGYFERKREAEAQLGVKFASYCSADYPMWLLAATTITVHRGDVKMLDLAALQQEPAENGWDAKLAGALTALGLTPNQKQPGWLLVSDWG